MQWGNLRLLIGLVYRKISRCTLGGTGALLFGCAISSFILWPFGQEFAPPGTGNGTGQALLFFATVVSGWQEKDGSLRGRRARTKAMRKKRKADAKAFRRHVADGVIINHDPELADEDAPTSPGKLTKRYRALVQVTITTRQCSDLIFVLELVMSISRARLPQRSTFPRPVMVDDDTRLKYIHDAAAEVYVDLALSWGGLRMCALQGRFLQPSVSAKDQVQAP